MIKVNLLPLKRKRKPKPIPTFIISTVIITLITIIVFVNLVFLFNSRLSAKKKTFQANEQKLAELKLKIKEVENYEQLNQSIQQKSNLIEQLRKNQSVPVKLLDEINNLLPRGVWLGEMTFSGGNVNIDGFAFENSDIVSYINNLKNSQLLTDVYLMESKSTTVEKIPLYTFKLTFRVKV